MTKPKAPLPTALTKIANRRQILGGFSALAVTTACGSDAQDVEGTGGAGGSGAGAGSGGSGAGAGGAGAGGTGSGAGAGGTGSGAGGSGAGGTTGGAGGTTGGAGGTTGGAGGTAGAGGSGGGGGLVPAPPPWDDVPVCTEKAEADPAGQGPFFIHELEKNDDVSLNRQDISGQYDPDAPEGVEMHLHLRLLDTTSTTCNDVPLKDVEVYIWHTDGQGYYSGFGAKGTASEQHPDEPYSGTPNKDQLENTDRFCRGMQTTDENGVVSFKTIFPGWYNGRDVHIHVIAFKKGSMSLGRSDYTAQSSGETWLLTSQFYFETAFSKSVHEQYEPYKARTTGSLAATYANWVDISNPPNSGLRAKASLDTSGAKPIVTAQLQLIIDPKA